MPLVINTNTASQSVQRQLSLNSNNLTSNFQKLSSGSRINSAKDDAAGLAIVNRFTSQIRGMSVAMRNAQDGISISQTTESALSEASNALQRMRELAIQSANGSNSFEDRQSLQAEVDQLLDEIDRIATTTRFNQLNVSNGSLANLSFQVGSFANNTITVSGADVRVSMLGGVEVSPDNESAFGSSTSSQLASTAGTTLNSVVVSLEGASSIDVLASGNG